MSETPSRNDPAGAEVPGEHGAGRQRPRRRRGLRIALISMASFVVLIGAVAAGGYAYVNHLAGSIQRIPVKFTRLTAATGGARLLRPHEGDERADHRRGIRPDRQSYARAAHCRPAA